MKFYLVPIGEQFSFQGQDYTKSGPLTASSEAEGKNKLIPRSANVKLINNAASPQTAAADEKTFPATELINMMNIYHHYCLECLQMTKAEINPQTFDLIKTKMDNAHQELINNLK